MKLDTTCPKCGSDNTYIRHTENVVLKTEHMAAKCHRCEYRWRLQPLTALERAQPVAGAAPLCPDCGAPLFTELSASGAILRRWCMTCRLKGPLGPPTPPPPARDEWDELADGLRTNYGLHPSDRRKLAAEFRRVAEEAREKALSEAERAVRGPCDRKPPEHLATLYCEGRRHAANNVAALRRTTARTHPDAGREKS